MKTSLANAALFDCECYGNYFLAAFKSVRNGKVVTFEKSARSVLDRPGLRQILHDYCTVGFNSINYDMVVASAALAGFGTKALKQISDDIILRGAKPWEIAREYDFAIINTDHIDLIEVAPGKSSLKIYNGKMHGKRMQDLPYDPETILTPEQMDATTVYCINDLDGTGLLLNQFRKQVELREQMSKEYGVDLRSKSDAQIAEAVIRSEYKRLTGEFPKKPKIEHGKQLSYKIPDFIEYRHPDLIAMLEVIRNIKFSVVNGKVKNPPEFVKLKMRIGESVYKMGIGGLHSTEKKRTLIAGDSTYIIDRDVRGYYPALMLITGLYPKHLGTTFRKILESSVKRRDRAKETGDSSTADTLKIVNNGTFGKTSSEFSFLFAPELMVATTLTGQLSLLMQIEWLEDAGFKVVSANTDGIMIVCPVERYDELNSIIAKWEAATGLFTEETRYASVHSRDVNSYIAIKPDGKYKKKGAYADPVPVASSWPSPSNEICTAAVVEFLKTGTPLRETIRACRDIRQFVCIRTVQGGAVKDDEYLGKAIRWYYANDVVGCISYKKNGNKVPRSDGAKPLMELPDEFPDDVDYAWYLAEAESILENVGYRKLYPEVSMSNDLLLAAVL